MQASPALDLHQTVQAALRDLLSVADLNHDDSWEVSASALPAAPGPQAVASARASRTSQATAAPGASACTVSQDLSLAAEEEEEEVREADLPPQAAARLYQARLRAAQAELAGLQDAVKGRDSKLGALEKEVQQLRRVGSGWQQSGGCITGMLLCLATARPAGEQCLLSECASHLRPNPCQQCRVEKAAWQKQHKALEAAAERSKRAAEEAQGRLSEQENALKQVGLERRASQQER